MIHSVIAPLEKSFDGLYNGVVIIDAKGTIYYVNKYGLELTGIEKSSMIGLTITKVIEKFPLDHLIGSGISFQNMMWDIRGRSFLASCTPIYNGVEIIGAICIFQAVNELQDRIKQSTNKNKTIFQLEDILTHLYDGVVIIDTRGYVEMINQAYCDFLEVEMEDVIGKHITETIPNSRMHIVMEKGESEIDSVMSVNGKDIIVRRTPIKKGGKIIGAIGKLMFKDINEVKVLAKKLDVIKNRLDYYKEELRKVRGAKYSIERIIGNHKKISDAKELAKKVAKSNSTVLISGESGTGKELFAHAIHEASDRSDGPLIRINCAAIPASIMEAELFGYDEGAFTGARKGGNPGKIEQAQGGTLFLDEIGDMPLEMQAKLLRVLQEKEIDRLGGKETKSVDIRIIAATHRPLEEMVKEGKFREDLYYRLNVFLIEIPPLRERETDIILTARHILDELNVDLGMKVKGFKPEVEDLIANYHWPGNIRELQNVIERSLHLVMNETDIGIEHLPPYLLDSSRRKSDLNTLEKEIEKAEKSAIITALKMSNGQRAKAAKILGIHRTSLYRKMEKYQLV